MYAATMDGVNHWHKHAFEKLGWMVLAYNRMSENKDMGEKIKMYMKELKHLQIALTEKMSAVQEVDRKMDLQIMLNNVVVLSAFVASTLGGGIMSGGAKRRVSRKKM